MVKNPPASSGDVDLIPGLGRSLGEGNDNIRQNYVSEIPRTEEPGGLQSMGSQTVRHNLVNKQQLQVDHLY